MANREPWSAWIAAGMVVLLASLSWRYYETPILEFKDRKFTPKVHNGFDKRVETAEPAAVAAARGPATATVAVANGS